MFEHRLDFAFARFEIHLCLLETAPVLVELMPLECVAIRCMDASVASSIAFLDIGGNSASPDTPRFTRSGPGQHEFVARLFGSGLSAHVQRPDSSVLESTR